MGDWLLRALFDWVFVLLFRILQGLLNLVDFIESFFDIFAGTAKIFYKGNSEFLINIFFGHDAVGNAFWAMALIAIVLAFGFAIVQMARKSTDVSGTVKQSVGQIMSNFIRCLVIILLLNAITVAAINITNVLLDRVNYALENAAVLDQQEADKTFTEQEYATMARVLATVANYSVNPTADSRYNVNSCFNAIRNDLLSLHVNGFFEYDYPMDANGHYSWQGALALLASSADLTTDLNLDTYYADVANAVQTVSQEISTYRDFAPVQSAHFAVSEAIDTDVLIFLITGMEAAQNSMYNNGEFNDTIRKGYISGEKSYNDLSQVRKDFDIWEMDYLVGYIACIVFVIIMTICIFTFIVRMFNLLLLYITSPLFVSSMPLDDGNKWQNWTQAFIIQLFSGFGMVIAMRLYLIIIPIVISSDLVFFAGSGVGYAVLNRMAQLTMVLGGAWAVLQAGGVITGILAGNPGMAAIQQEGRIGGMVTNWAMRAPRAAVGAARDLAQRPYNMAKGVEQARGRHMQQQEQRANLAARKAQQRQNKADALFQKADAKIAAGRSGHSVQRTMSQAGRAQGRADRATAQAEKMRAQAGLGSVTPKPAYSGMGGGSSDRESGGELAGVGASVSTAPPPRPRGRYTSGTTDGPLSGGVSGGGVSGGGTPGRGVSGGGASSSGTSGGRVVSTSGAASGSGPSKRWTPPSLSSDAPAPRARASAPGGDAPGGSGTAGGSRGTPPPSGGVPRTPRTTGDSQDPPPSGGTSSTPPKRKRE